MATMADIIGEQQERQLRGTVYADALLKEVLQNLIQEAQENPVEPTPIIVRGEKARRLLAQDRPVGQGRGWRRERAQTRMEAR